MESAATYLTPGQRYITVLGVSHGDDGAVRVAYRCPGGMGQIVPVASADRIVSC